MDNPHTITVLPGEFGTPAGKWTNRNNLMNMQQAAAAAANIIKDPAVPLEYRLRTGITVWSGGADIVTLSCGHIMLDEEVDYRRGAYIAQAIKNAIAERQAAEAG
jgi:hypothetical protein